MNTSCDHVVAFHGATPIRTSKFDQAARGFASAVAFFDRTLFAVPHPGFFRIHRFCPMCGQAVDVPAQNRRLVELLTAAESGCQWGPADFNAWLDSVVSPAPSARALAELSEAHLPH